MRQRWLILIGLAVIALVAVLALLPWWLPLVARPIAARQHITFDRYERLGYSRFALNHVAVQRGAVTVTVDRVEADTPLLWAWRHLRGNETRTVVTHWSVDVQKHTPSPPTGPSGWVPLREQLQRVAAMLDHWLPDAEVGNGVVRWPGGEVSLSAAQWRRGTLRVRDLRFRTIAADATFVFDDNGELTVTAADPREGAQATLASCGARVTGSVIWWDQPAKIDVKFAPEGWAPQQADLRADDLRLSGERLKLGSAYAAVTGHASVAWSAGHFSADVFLHGAPVSGKSAPPLDITGRAHGDTQTMTIEALHAVMPGGEANLSAPVTIERSGRIRETAAQFAVHFDLAQLPWSHAHGVLAGNARVVASGGMVPPLEFSLNASDVSFTGVSLRHAEIGGQLTWPLLQVKRLNIVGNSGEALEAHGAWNFHDKQLADASVAGTISSQTIARWLPKTMTFHSAKIAAHVAGRWPGLEHSGNIEIAGLHVASLKPGAVQLTWNGNGSDVSSFSAAVVSGDGRINAAGAVNGREARITQFTLLVHSAAALSLTQPVRIAWRPALQIDALHLTGSGASVDAAMAWGRTGRIDAAVRGFSSRWLTAFVNMRGPEWTVHSLAVRGSWANGPLVFSTAGELVIALPNQRRATINLAAKGDAHGLAVDALHAVENGNPVVNASGLLPITITPGGTPFVDVDPAGPLKLEALSVPDAPFWQQLAAMTGVELRAPEVAVHVNGTWSKPTGTITLRVEHAAMDPKRFPRPLPTVDGVDVAVSADRGGLRLDRFSFSIEGQMVHAAGKVGFDRDTWSQLVHSPMPYLRQHSELRIEVPDAQVAMFSRYLPAALAPAGRLQADIRFDRGSLGGFLRIHDAASRPLGPLGVLQQVNAEVDFSDRGVVLRRVTATAGGQPVTVSGSVELPNGAWIPGGTIEPKYDVTLQGHNLPFVRQAGLLVRGDLDLKLQTPAKGPPGINGKVVLRDSLFLTDVRSFLPHGGTASPERRPPYFSVTTAPLNTWTLDVDVSGSRFMRIRTPVFTGVASARFHLGGTLGDPRAIGDAIIDEGTVRMPFAAFDVKQGAVRLTEESPYEPTIFLRGTGRHYGYDLTMEISGKASAPNIAFTSSPALEAEQVLLMVMTGAAPANEVNTSLTHRAVQIGAFFGQSVLSSLTGGSVEPDRLTIESGEKISEQGKETYSIEYKLNDRWSVTGEYDEFDEYNAGFKWRLAPKKVPR